MRSYSSRSSAIAVILSDFYVARYSMKFKNEQCEETCVSVVLFHEYWGVLFKIDWQRRVTQTRKSQRCCKTSFLMNSGKISELFLTIQSVIWCWNFCFAIFQWPCWITNAVTYWKSFTCHEILSLRQNSGLIQVTTAWKYKQFKNPSSKH